MSSTFAHSVPLLGALQEVESYLEHDAVPLVLSLCGNSGDMYLAVNVEETDERELIYYFVRVSPERLASIEEGEIDLRDAFLMAEDGRVFEVFDMYSRNPLQCKEILAADIPAEYLSEKGLTLLL